MSETAQTQRELIADVQAQLLEMREQVMDDYRRYGRLRRAAESVLQAEYPREGSERQPGTPERVSRAWAELREALREAPR